MIFESNHSIIESEYIPFRNDSGSFPTHLHRSFEYIAQISGLTRVTIDGTEYDINGGEAVLIFPYQRHRIEAIRPGIKQFCIFSPDLVADYVQSLSGRLPTSAKMIAADTNLDIGKNPLLAKACAYTVCGLFDEGRCYENTLSLPSSPILTELLLYAETHFATDCSLKQASVQLGYDYAYLSRLFKQHTGVSFSHYTNLLRIRRAEQLLLSTRQSISVIAEQCGYSSLRSFDRQFRAISHQSPRQYRSASQSDDKA